MSLLDRIRALFSSENHPQQENPGEVSHSDDRDLGLWFDQGYCHLRSEHEWLINGQPGRPWRLYPGSRERGTVAQMIERFTHLTVSKNMYSMAWDGNEWKCYPILDPAYADVMPAFLPLPDEKINPRLAVVYVMPGPTNANGAFYGILDGQGVQRGEEIYFGMRFTALVWDDWNRRAVSQYLFSYDHDFNPLAIREMTIQRLDAMRKDINNQFLDDDDNLAIGYRNPFDEVKNGAEDVDEIGHIGEGLPKLLYGFEEINRMSLRHVIGSEACDVYEAAQKLGETYYRMGLYSKAMYYLELAHYGLNRGGEYEPLMRDCMIKMRDFRVSSALTNNDEPGQWSGRNFTRFAMVLEECLGCMKGSLSQMAVVKDGDLKNIQIVRGEDIKDFDIIDVMKDASIVQAFIASDYWLDYRTLAVELRYYKGKIVMAVLQTGYPYIKSEPYCLKFTFGTDSWVSKSEFLEKRTAAAQRLVDGEPLQADDHLLLGTCENAHLCVIRAEAAAKAEAMGDALYYLHKAYYDITSRIGKENLEHWDLSLIGHICYKLGFIFNELGFYELSLSYLYKLESSQNINDLAEIATSLSLLKDMRAVPFLRQQILDQRIKAAQNNGKDFHPGYLRYLRGRLAFAMLDRNRPDIAKRELGSLMCDPDPLTKEFAAIEMQRIIDQNL